MYMVFPLQDVQGLREVPHDADILGDKVNIMTCEPCQASPRVSMTSARLLLFLSKISFNFCMP